MGKRLVTAVPATLLLLYSISAGGNEGSAAAVLEVRGMVCGSCAKAVEQGLGRQGGVTGAVVDLAANRVTVTYDPRSMTPEKLVKLMRGLGYEAKPVKRH